MSGYVWLRLYASDCSIRPRSAVRGLSPCFYPPFVFVRINYIKCCGRLRLPSHVTSSMRLLARTLYKTHLLSRAADDYVSQSHVHKLYSQYNQNPTFGGMHNHMYHYCSLTGCPTRIKKKARPEERTEKARLPRPRQDVSFTILFIVDRVYYRHNGVPTCNLKEVRRTDYPL